MDKIEQLLLQYKEEMMETLQKWVRIPSVKDEPASGAPFGVEAAPQQRAAPRSTQFERLHRHHRHREADHQTHEVKQKRIAQGDGQIRHFVDDELKFINPYPLAAPDALGHAVFLERQHQPGHGLIAENDVKDHRQDQHDIQPPVTHNRLPEGGSGYASGRQLVFFHTHGMLPS